MEGVYVTELIDGCKMTYIDKSRQPFFTIVLDCPGVDSIRVWPLPIQHDWMEDWFKDPSITRQNAWGSTGGGVYEEVVVLHAVEGFGDAVEDALSLIAGDELLVQNQTR